MPLLKLDRLCEGLEKGDWAGFLRDWDRALRAGNHPETTRYNYLLAAAQRSPSAGPAVPGRRTRTVLAPAWSVRMSCGPASVRPGERRGLRRLHRVDRRGQGYALTQHRGGTG